ncbi:MAG: AAA family ATPase, partial [Thermomicrobiaceae bacterium]|nr:AAA family ATPase [Thermomicrobiaceae bacterium]
RASSDGGRKQRGGLAPGERRPAEFGAGLYSPERTRQTYEALLDRAREGLAAGQSVVLDATFLDPEWRERAREVAVEFGAEVLLVECQCPPEVVRERLAFRSSLAQEPSDADWAVYQRQRERYGAAIAPVLNLPRIVVDTDRPTAQVLEDVLARLDLKRRI